MITNQDAYKLYSKYVEGWKAVSHEERARIAAEAIDENARYATPQHETGSRDTMIEDMASFQAQFPGGRFEVGDVSAHHDVALLTWVLVTADEQEVARGHDKIRVSPEGKIASLITFAPSVTQP
jgi:hypothetical protein